jgi:hypothetical protein
MSRAHHAVICEAEAAQFLSEKAIMRGGVTVVTLTSSSVFAAKNLPVYDRKGAA